MSGTGKKIAIGIVVLVVLVGIALAIYFGTKKSSSTTTDSSSGSSAASSSGSSAASDTTGSSAANTSLKARYIKISNPKVSCMNIAEIQVFSSEGGDNIAKGKVSTKSSDYDNILVAGNITDGDLKNLAHTSCKDTPWMQVDLGSDLPIYSIVVVNRLDCCQGRIKGSVLEIINNANTSVWSSNPFKGPSGDATSQDGIDGFGFYMFNLPAKDPIIPGQLSGQFVRLFHNVAACLNIAEIEVRSTEGGTDIARGKAWSKNSGYSGDSYPIGNVTDGNLDNFAHTACNGSDVPWMEVDLGAEVSISQLVVHNRKDCCTGRVVGAQLEILNKDRRVLWRSMPIKDKAGANVPAENNGYSRYEVNPNKAIEVTGV